LVPRAGIYPAELDKWCTSVTAALADPKDARASPQATRQDRKHFKEFDRELLRKEPCIGRDRSATGPIKKSHGDPQ